MTITEYVAEVAALGEKLNKALAEILAAIEVGQTVSQDAIDKLNAAKATAQSLDDLNEDAPPPEPPPEP